VPGLRGELVKVWGRGGGPGRRLRRGPSPGESVLERSRADSSPARFDSRGPAAASSSGINSRNAPRPEIRAQGLIKPWFGKQPKTLVWLYWYSFLLLPGTRTALPKHPAPRRRRDRPCVPP
jgi:hypothetical protein